MSENDLFSLVVSEDFEKKMWDLVENDILFSYSYKKMK